MERARRYMRYRPSAYTWHNRSSNVDARVPHRRQMVSPCQLSMAKEFAQLGISFGTSIGSQCMHGHVAFVCNEPHTFNQIPEGQRCDLPSAASRDLKSQTPTAEAEFARDHFSCLLIITSDARARRLAATDCRASKTVDDQAESDRLGLGCVNTLYCRNRPLNEDMYGASLRKHETDSDESRSDGIVIAPRHRSSHRFG